MRFFNRSTAFNGCYTRAYAACLGLGATLLMAAGYPVPAPPSLGRPVAAPAALPDTTAYRLRGRLLDSYTQEPLPAATLWLKQLAMGTLSDEDGYFSFELTAEQLATNASDTLQVKASAFGLQTLPITFLQQPADSLLRLVVRRDSIVSQRALPTVPRREARRLGKASVRPLAPRASN